MYRKMSTSASALVAVSDRFPITRPCDGHLQSSEIFPELQCQSYSEVIEDTAGSVNALHENMELQGKFISTLKRPHTSLLELSNEMHESKTAADLILLHVFHQQQLHALKERLVSQFAEREKMTAFPELLNLLSTPAPHTMHQVKALTIATEAFRELSPVSVHQILKLTTEEKRNLLILFQRIPIFSSAHGFLQPALPESNPVYDHLLSRIGFTDWKGHLMYEKQMGHCGLDKITLTIIAIHSITTADIHVPVH